MFLFLIKFIIFLNLCLQLEVYSLLLPVWLMGIHTVIFINLIYNFFIFTAGGVLAPAPGLADGDPHCGVADPLRPLLRPQPRPHVPRPD